MYQMFDTIETNLTTVLNFYGYCHNNHIDIRGTNNDIAKYRVPDISAFIEIVIRTYSILNQMKLDNNV